MAGALAACASSADGKDRRGATGAEPTPIPTAAAAARPTYTVTRGEVAKDVTFGARVAPSLVQSLAFAQDGVVSQTYVREGQAVQAGDLIAELDTAELDAQLVLARSALAIAEERLAAVQREIDLGRNRAEIRRDLAQTDLDFAVQQGGAAPTAAQQHEIDRLTLLLQLAQLDVDELNVEVDPELASEVDSARLRVDELEQALTQTGLFAPFDGELINLGVSPGRAVTAGDSVGAVADAAEIVVGATVREAELEQLAEQMVASVRPGSGPGEALNATITHLPFPYGSGGEGVAGEEDATVRIEFDDMGAAREAFAPGDRVTVVVRVDERNNTLWLPPAAIRDFNGRKFVVIQEGDVQQRADVMLGILGQDRVEVLSGVEEGQTIVGQ